jgi:hypothetical protein
VAALALRLTCPILLEIKITPTVKQNIRASNQVFKFVIIERVWGCRSIRIFGRERRRRLRQVLVASAAYATGLLGLCLLSADTKTPSCLEPRRDLGGPHDEVEMYETPPQEHRTASKVPLLLPPPALRECCYCGPRPWSFAARDGGTRESMRATRSPCGSMSAKPLPRYCCHHGQRELLRAWAYSTRFHTSSAFPPEEVRATPKVKSSPASLMIDHF